MVGSVLMQRMQQEGDFSRIEPTFFSTSNHGGAAPSFAEGDAGILQDAYDLDALEALPIIVTAQGGDYPRRYTRSCVPAAGTDYGSMPLPRSG